MSDDNPRRRATDTSKAKLWLAGTLLTTLLGTLVTSGYRWVDAKEKRLVSVEEKEEKDSKDIAVLTEAVTTIKKDVSEIKETQKEIGKDIKDLLKEQRRPR